MGRGRCTGGSKGGRCRGSKGGVGGSKGGVGGSNGRWKKDNVFERGRIEPAGRLTLCPERESASVSPLITHR